MKDKESITAEAVERLKKSNIRITPQRFAVLEYLIQSHSHPTADEIYRALETRFPNMSVATVYNNLRLFTNIGFVTEMSYGDSSSRFDFTSTKHYHAICNNCGKVEDFHYPILAGMEEEVSAMTGYEISSHRLEVYGLCQECKNKKV